MTEKSAGAPAGDTAEGLVDGVLRDAADRAPLELALVSEGRSWTFAELHARATAVAKGVAFHTNAGARVAILSGNRGEYVECYYGVPRAGRVLVPLHPRLHPAEWRATLVRSGAAMLIGEHALLERVGDTGIPTFDLDGSGAGSYGTLTSTRAAPDALAAERSPSDLAFLIGTSGTTGAPKLAMLLHENFAASVGATLAARPVADDDVLLTPFPLCHVAGYNVFVYHARARPIVLVPQFDPRVVAELVAAHGVTALLLAPTMIAMLLDDPVVDDRDLATLRSIGYGASSIPAPVLQRAVARWSCDFSQGYGMTELAGNAVFLGADEHRRAAAGDLRLLRAAGRPSPGVEVRIARADGEVLIRAPQVMAGYWGDEPATTAALREGWLHTGDVGTIDDDGLLTLIDRTKDIVVTGGENVASREVEAALFEHPGVRDVAVIGVADDRWGERVTAVVVPADGWHPDGAELIRFARQSLAGFKAPKSVTFVAELPRNATGKVLKHVLRGQIEEREP